VLLSVPSVAAGINAAAELLWVASHWCWYRCGCCVQQMLHVAATAAVDVLVRTRFMKACRHARVAHSRHSVFPVPVGLSNKAFSDCRTTVQAHVSDAWQLAILPIRPSTAGSHAGHSAAGMHLLQRPARVHATPASSWLSCWPECCWSAATAIASTISCLANLERMAKVMNCDPCCRKLCCYSPTWLLLPSKF
jgi:hypothetical protein